MTIDYRSDTVTRPTPGMLEAMMRAKVGDDVLGDDPSVNELEALSADLFGMEAALFCPSGTMTNQIAIKCHTQPGDEVICDFTSHIYQYEGGGIAFNAGASVQLINGDRGRVTAEQVRLGINADDVHKAHTSLVSLENTCNRGGGSCYEIDELRKIRAVCDEHNLKLHLDGARIYNALVAKKQSAQEFGQLFHTISVCLSKGLGCPVGSVLIGPADFIKKARRVRKVLGGGMRQAGFIAAAGIFALRNHVDRLAEDHDHAQQLGNALANLSFVARVLPVETNIVIFEVVEGLTAPSVVAQLKEKGVWAYAISSSQVRLVTHLDVSAEMVKETIQIFEQL
ncbi:MAG TPA: low-specificity L-threonine aldolase [Flavisolibacter sp.]|nr:low-specificity L-threonine aldolase [Flavisolibacter sp.]